MHVLNVLQRLMICQAKSSGIMLQRLVALFLNQDYKKKGVVQIAPPLYEKLKIF